MPGEPDGKESLGFFGASVLETAEVSLLGLQSGPNMSSSRSFDELTMKSMGKKANEQSLLLPSIMESDSPY